jgi:sulfate/thiosulfate transport system substrate-binding protein
LEAVLRSLIAVAVGYLILLPAIAWLLVWQQSPDQALLNVSYDPTRELWKEINREFIRHEQETTGKKIAINQSHGGSGSQARAVIDGLEADVVSLAMWPDTNAISKQGLIAPGWERRLRNRSLPYYSTIVFVVREGNPKKVRDWDDLIKPGVTVITPNPKTSGNGKLTLLAAWGAKLLQTGNEAEAERFVSELYRHAPILDASARGSAMTFVQKRIGDVHIAWENEAHLERKESGERLELIYPRRSIKAEPQVALVDAVVDRKGTRELAERYLDFLYTDAVQKIIAGNYYRPSDDSKRDRSELRDLELFGIDAMAPDWDAANEKFFGDGGVFDRIYQK